MSINTNFRESEFEVMGRACSRHRGEEECINGFGGKVRRKETTRKI
jgi:hypothetical protein